MPSPKNTMKLFELPHIEKLVLNLIQLKFLQFLPRFQALPLETFDNNIRKYSPTTCFNRLIKVTVIRDADKANQDKIGVLIL